MMKRTTSFLSLLIPSLAFAATPGSQNWFQWLVELFQSPAAIALYSVTVIVMAIMWGFRKVDWTFFLQWSVVIVVVFGVTYFMDAMIANV